MLKRLVGKLFGFAREIQNLQDQVSELQWDSTFGMWTREAFLQFCQVMPRGNRVIAFIDIDDVHGMNDRWGYEDVNQRIKDAFSVYFRRSDIVARWFSGDEIVILFDADEQGAAHKLEQLTTSSGRREIKFEYAVGEWKVGREAIEETIDRLASAVQAQKTARRTETDPGQDA